MNLIEFKQNFLGQNGEFKYDLLRTNMENYAQDNKIQDFVGLHANFCIYFAIKNQSSSDNNTFKTWQQMFFHTACLCGSKELVKKMTEISTVTSKMFFEGLYYTTINTNLGLLEFLHQNINEILKESIEINQGVLSLISKHGKESHEISYIKLTNPSANAPKKDLKPFMERLFNHFHSRINILEHLAEKDKIQLYQYFIEKMDFKLSIDKETINKLGERGSINIIQYLVNNNQITQNDFIHLVISQNSKKVLDTRNKKILEKILSFDEKTANTIRKKLKEDIKQITKEQIPEWFNNILEEHKIKKTLIETKKAVQVKLL